MNRRDFTKTALALIGASALPALPKPAAAAAPAGYTFSFWAKVGADRWRRYTRPLTDDEARRITEGGPGSADLVSRIQRETIGERA